MLTMLRSVFLAHCFLLNFQICLFYRWQHLFIYGKLYTPLGELSLPQGIIVLLTGSQELESHQHKFRYSIQQILLFR